MRRPAPAGEWGGDERPGASRPWQVAESLSLPWCMSPNMGSSPNHNTKPERRTEKIFAVNMTQNVGSYIFHICPGVHVQSHRARVLNAKNHTQIGAT